MKNHRVDSIFLGIVITLLSVGAVSFVSASLGVLAKNEVKFYGVLTNQLLFGLLGGGIAMYVTSRIKYTLWRKYAFFIFLGSIFLTLLVFVPHLGFSHGGARRWVTLGFISFQPVEFLKIGFVMYFAAWLSWIKTKVQDFKYGILPLVLLLGLIALILFKQPDTKSFMLVFAAGASMLFVSGVRMKYLIIVFITAIIGLSVLVFYKPYLLERVMTFVNPGRDPQGSSYQLEQSLIALGSGGITGRGLGQSIQKFSYLPEPQGDSIFAVIGEEFGFVGTVIIVLLFFAFCLRGLKVAYQAPDAFSRLLATGIVILLGAQAFLNIASIVGLFPLTGVPLVFISHGGTSLMVSLAAVGIVLNISRFRKLERVH